MVAQTTFDAFHRLLCERWLLIGRSAARPGQSGGGASSASRRLQLNKDVRRWTNYGIIRHHKDQCFKKTACFDFKPECKAVLVEPFYGILSLIYVNFANFVDAMLGKTTTVLLKRWAATGRTRTTEAQWQISEAKFTTQFFFKQIYLRAPVVPYILDTCIWMHIKLVVIIPPGRGCRPEVYHGKKPLGFLRVSFRVCLGFV